MAKAAAAAGGLARPHALPRARPDRGARQAHRLRRRTDHGLRDRAGIRRGGRAARRSPRDDHRGGRRPTNRVPAGRRTGAPGGPLVELPDDRRPANRPEFPRRTSRRGRGVRQRSAGGRRDEQLQRHDGRRVSGPGRRQPPRRAAGVSGQHPKRRPIWRAISARSRTGRRSARWSATAAWARSAAARTTRRCSKAGPAA